MFKNELIFETSFKKYILSNGARSFPGIKCEFSWNMTSEKGLRDNR